MAKKKKHPEHENLERWLISYADFITLLFATFVVLYALSQVDIKDFQALEGSIKSAFSAPSIMQGSEGLMENSSDSILGSSQADSMILPLMMEYISQKYEQESMEDIEKSINEKIKSKEIDGVEVFETDKGLLIRFDDTYLFESGSAKLTQNAKLKLDKVGASIAKKFILHNMRVEGHTDNKPIHSPIFPSNWELSTARASSVIRYFIERFSFLPGIFTAVGFADTRPVSKNDSPKEQAKNRRIEILILKNKFKSQESPTNTIMNMTRQEQEQMQAQRMDTINRIDAISQEAKKTKKNDKQLKKEEEILNKLYEKELERLSKEGNAMDQESKAKITGTGDWLKPPSIKDSKLNIVEENK
jgi:chemotaxis protein MotB